MLTLMRRRWPAAATVAAAGLIAATLAYAAVGLPALCPGSNTIAGWKALEADKLASSPDELWKIYDGGDGEWKTAGVTSAFQRYYKHDTTKRVLTLVINKTGGDWQKAKALYRSKDAAFKGQTGFQTVQLTQEGSLATPTAGLQAHFWNKYYYCTIQINGTSAAEVSAAKQFMTKISANITANG